MNIGIRFLQEMGAVLDFGENSLHIGSVSIQLLPPKKNASFSTVESIDADTAHSKPSHARGEIRAYNKNTITIPPHSISIIQLKLHSKEDRLNNNADKHPPILEVETDPKFAESINLANPLNSVTSAEHLLLPLANETDEKITIKRNKRVGTISVLQAEPQESDTSTKELDASPASDSASDPENPDPKDRESAELEETILDEADQEHFAKASYEKRS